MRHLSRHSHYALILWGLLISMNTKADVWANPKVMTFFSENRQFKLIIKPEIVPDKYYLWNYYKSNKHPQTKRGLRKKEKFMQNISRQDTVLIPCTAELYRVNGADSVAIWKRPLLNRICPVYAIVANDGSSIATFDNWYSTGYGVNVFVVYNEKGDVKSTYKLDEISPFPLNDYMGTISSLHWNLGNKYIDNERIEITFGTKQDKQKKRIYNTKYLKFEK